MTNSQENFFKHKILGHPAGLFVLFFTEMWERFSFYGMRVLLINFLTMAVVSYNPGWSWSAENAGALFGTYAMLLYLTPIAGGIIADRFTGYRWAVVIGSIIMTLGHVCMALETEFWLYIGLGLLVIGTGFFKPNITSVISEMYKDFPEKKDGAYTIFYMGVNAGAFFGMMLCGYLAERVGWAWGFGLAGIFMLLGTLQFWLAKPLFGTIGDVPKKEGENNRQIAARTEETKEEEKRNPFTIFDKILVVACSVIGIGYAINDPLSKIAKLDMFSFASMPNIEGQYVAAILGLVLFFVLVVTRIKRYTKIVRDRMISFIIFGFFTIFFWMSFEQGATSLIIFARDSIDRNLSGISAILFNIVNTLLTIVPLGIVTYVLYRLFKETHKKILKSNLILALCFVGIWGLAIWMLQKDWSSVAYIVEYEAIESPLMENGQQVKDYDGNLVYTYTAISENLEVPANAETVNKTTKVVEDEEFGIGQSIYLITKNNQNTNYGYLSDERLQKAREIGEKKGIDNGVIVGRVKSIESNEVEITVSWFSILNSFFIIALANIFSKWWDSKHNPSASLKYGLGLIVMAIGFGLLAIGSYGIKDGVKVSMVWLILAYLFHTLGELFLSPVGLSYVSKLVPARMIAFMFGMWFLVIAIGNKLAAIIGGQIHNITKEYSLSTFFLIVFIVPAAAGVVVILINPLMKKLMHGVK